MKKLSLLLLIITFNLFSQSNITNRSYIETTAVSDTLVTPDRITLSILISEKNTRGKLSTEALEAKMLTVLNSLNIDIEKQLTLNDVSSNFKKYFLKKQEVLKDKSYSLLVYDAETAGKVIIQLENEDISNVYLTELEYSKIEELEFKVTQNAVIKAKKKVNMMLNPLNQKTGKVIYMTDFNNSNNIINSLSGKVSGLRIRGINSVPTALGISRNNQLQIEFEKIKVEKSVQIKFEIE